MYKACAYVLSTDCILDSLVKTAHLPTRQVLPVFVLLAIFYFLDLDLGNEVLRSYR